ncbi:MAG: hypothetical protein DRJ66_06440 [Thermoprotei archaeon]|nr:MAG: hypothetical protein DRJ66_06440 [Thermoprotei archaeon]RLF20459.1 MAG: hypothetical protein DRZ82_02140 [Thermoprotei archaeon]
MKTNKRVFILGIDALSPKIVEHFVKEGILPNFAKLMREGGFSKALPAIPAQTPENWTTIATGAWPGTHGIAVWGRHDYGRPVTDKRGHEAMSSNLCKAEYLWEAAARQGLRSVVLYFIGYPPTTDKAIYVDWFWAPGRFYFEICSAACYINYISEELKEKIKARPRRFKGKVFLVEFKKAEGWNNLPEGKTPPLEGEIHVEPNVGGKGVTYYVLLLDSKGEGYDSCLIAKEKDASKALCILRPGEWSEWFKEEFEIEGEKKIGTVRFKLIELSKDGKRFRLYRSQVYPISGFTHPPEVGKELVEKIGPYINEGVTLLFFAGLVDEQTFIEEHRYRIKWISRAAKYLMDKYNASIFIMHWHPIDAAQHRTLGQVDPEGGEYDPTKREKAMHILKITYQLADELVGEFLKFVDDKTYVIVVSDHGNAPNKKVCSIVKALAERGLVCIEKDEKGRERVNWKKSKVFIDLTNVYVNLKSRYVDGIVDDSEYEKIRDEVIDVLRSCKDDEGNYVVLFALKREDAPLINLWGPHVGDVVFVYSQGFTWGTEPMEPRCRVRGGANHGSQPPTAETEFSSNYAAFFIIGPGIKRGYRRPIDFLGPVQLVDIAPTVSYLLGILPPRHSQGRILYDFLEGWDVSEMKRKGEPIKRKRELPPLKGDVTDLII